MTSPHNRHTVMMLSGISGVFKGDPVSRLPKPIEQIHKKWLGAFNGRWMQQQKDKILMSFQSESEAVHCAAAIIHECESYEELDIRIAIHKGELLMVDGQATGKGFGVLSSLLNATNTPGLIVTQSIVSTLYGQDDIRSKPADGLSFSGKDEIGGVYLVQVEFPHLADEVEIKKKGAERFADIPPQKNILTQRYFILFTAFAILLFLILILYWIFWE